MPGVAHQKKYFLLSNTPHKPLMFGGWFNKKIKISNPAFFGVHWSQGGVSPTSLFFLRTCCSWLEQPSVYSTYIDSLSDNVVEEGIYRKSAEVLMMQRLRDHIDKGRRNAHIGAATLTFVQFVRNFLG